jgi:hypothetical protein
LATLTIHVAAVNDSPVAVEDSAETSEDTAVATDVVTNDADVDNVNAQLLVKAGSLIATNGSATLGVDGRTIHFTPDANTNDLNVDGDGFTVTYRTTDGDLDSNEATLTIDVSEVNDAPIAVGDSATVAEDGTTSVDVRANDSAGPRESGQSLTVTIETAPAHGTAVVVAGQVKYTPAADYNGPDSFSYTITDDGTTDGVAEPLSDTATVDVTVTEVNDAPTAVADSATTAEDGSVLVDVKDNDSTGPANESGQSLTITIETAPEHGTAAVESGQVRYTPNADYNGPDSFTYTITDNGTTNGIAEPESDTATVDVTGPQVNDAPVAVDDSG